MAKVVFKKGLATDIPQQIKDGQILVETDTGIVHIDVTNEKRVTYKNVPVVEILGGPDLFTAEAPGTNAAAGSIIIGHFNSWGLSQCSLNLNDTGAKPIKYLGKTFAQSGIIKNGSYWIMVYDPSLESGISGEEIGGWNCLVGEGPEITAGRGITYLQSSAENSINLGQSVHAGHFSASENFWHNILTCNLDSIGNLDYCLSGFLIVDYNTAMFGAGRPADKQPKNCVVYISIQRPRASQKPEIKANVIHSDFTDISMRIGYGDHSENPDYNEEINYDNRGRISLDVEVEVKELGTYTVTWINLSNDLGESISHPVFNDLYNSYNSLYGENWANYIEYSDPILIVEQSSSSEQLVWENI